MKSENPFSLQPVKCTKSHCRKQGDFSSTPDPPLKIVCKVCGFFSLSFSLLSLLSESEGNAVFFLQVPSLWVQAGPLLISCGKKRLERAN